MKEVNFGKQQEVKVVADGPPHNKLKQTVTAVNTPKVVKPTKVVIKKVIIQEAAPVVEVVVHKEVEVEAAVVVESVKPKKQKAKKTKVVTP